MLHTIKTTEPPMTGSGKTTQFLHENITWKRLLDFFIQENIFLKNRLSEVVDRETDRIIIARAEQFQNDFILKDGYIKDIGNDIKRQQVNLQLAVTQKKVPDIKTCKMQDKLRNEISYLEIEFSDLKNQFNKYLLSII